MIEDNLVLNMATKLTRERERDEMLLGYTELEINVRQEALMNGCVDAR